MQANQHGTYAINRNGQQVNWVATEKLPHSFWWHGLMFFISRVTNFTASDDHLAETIIEFALLSQAYIALSRKTDTRPRMKYFGQAIRKFSPHTTYNMALSMLRDGHSIKDLYERKFFDFDAIDAAIKTARDNQIIGRLGSKCHHCQKPIPVQYERADGHIYCSNTCYAQHKESQLPTVDALECSHCHRSALDVTIRVVHALNPIVYCGDCYDAFNQD
jgi:hypothetical protein